MYCAREAQGSSPALYELLHGDPCLPFQHLGGGGRRSRVQGGRRPRVPGQSGGGREGRREETEISVILSSDYSEQGLASLRLDCGNLDGTVVFRGVLYDNRNQETSMSKVVQSCS